MLPRSPSATNRTMASVSRTMTAGRSGVEGDQHGWVRGTGGQTSALSAVAPGRQTPFKADNSKPTTQSNKNGNQRALRDFHF
jgi:hypothetical protein